MALKAIALLDVVRASQDVMEARRAFGHLVEEAQEAVDRAAYRDRLYDAEQSFRRACADHLAEVWPVDPKSDDGVGSPAAEI